MLEAKPPTGPPMRHVEVPWPDSPSTSRTWASRRPTHSSSGSGRTRICRVVADGPSGRSGHAAALLAARLGTRVRDLDDRRVPRHERTPGDPRAPVERGRARALRPPGDGGGAGRGRGDHRQRRRRRHRGEGTGRHGQPREGTAQRQPLPEGLVPRKHASTSRHCTARSPSPAPAASACSPTRCRDASTAREVVLTGDADAPRLVAALRPRTEAENAGCGSAPLRSPTTAAPRTSRTTSSASSTAAAI